VEKETIKHSSNPVETFIALKKMDSLNEKLDKNAVKRAHERRQKKNEKK
jgi:hypothetical protein